MLTLAIAVYAILASLITCCSMRAQAEQRLEIIKLKRLLREARKGRRINFEPMDN